MEVIVIGGGAAGMMAAIMAARCGNHVRLFEKNNKLGKKLFLTGKGRCNLTNACDVEELFNYVINNSKFLYSSIYDFDNKETVKFFESIGLRTKIERGGRVFPLSDHSSDVIKVLESEMKRQGVEICLNTEVIEILVKEIEDKITAVSKSTEDFNGNLTCESSVKTSGRNKNKNKTKVKKGFNYLISGVALKDGSVLNCDKIIMATGGESYSSTGSDGKSFKMLDKLGIKVTDRRPALVPLCVRETFVSEMAGLSLKNISCSLFSEGKLLYHGFGEMLFTHTGVSGPLILSASSHLKNGDYNSVTLSLDLKPALSLEELDSRILRDFSQSQNKQFKNSLGQLLPSSLITPVINMSGIDPNKQINSITREERLRLCDVIKNFVLNITGDRGFNEAIITRGGVAVSGINPSTMEARQVKGLFFAGEMIDVDALTGGFNLQIAWSTAHLAGIQEEL